MVGDAPVASFAGLYQILHDLGDGLWWRALIAVVQKIEVNIVGAQAVEAFFEAVGEMGAGVADALAGVAVACGGQRAGNLGADDDFVAATSDRPPEYLFGSAPAVGLRCVEEVDALVQAVVEHG